MSKARRVRWWYVIAYSRKAYPTEIAPLHGKPVHISPQTLQRFRRKERAMALLAEIKLLPTHFPWVDVRVIERVK